MYRGKARLNMTQQVGPCTEHVQTVATYNEHIYLYKQSFPSGRAQQSIFRAYALL